MEHLASSKKNVQKLDLGTPPHDNWAVLLSNIAEQYCLAVLLCNTIAPLSFYLSLYSTLQYDYIQLYAYRIEDACHLCVDHLTGERQGAERGSGPRRGCRVCGYNQLINLPRCANCRPIPRLPPRAPHQYTGAVVTRGA